MDEDVEEITAKKPTIPPRVLPRGRMARKMAGKLGRGGGVRRGGAARRVMGRGGGGGRMAGMAGMDPMMMM